VKKQLQLFESALVFSPAAASRGVASEAAESTRTAGLAYSI